MKLSNDCSLAKTLRLLPIPLMALLSVHALAAKAPFGDEASILSNEAPTRTDISLPGAQQRLIHVLAETGKPIVLVVIAGRPLVLEKVLPRVCALVFPLIGGAVADQKMVADRLYV
ncbi:MAG: hypothetical protein RLZZ214_1997 [Verrucomicrobiota bacterium]|jgi:hypothetical protein